MIPFGRAAPVGGGRAGRIDRRRPPRPSEPPPQIGPDRGERRVTQAVDVKTPPLTTLLEDEVLLRDSVREFAEQQVKPLVREMDEHAKIPRELIDRLFDLGVMGIEIPERFGGSGGTFFHAVLAVEALSQVDPSVGVLVDVQNTLVINALLRWANEPQLGRYLPALATKTLGAYALSEAGSGSDAFALTSRAVDAGDAWVLNGRKLWITNGNEADLFIVFATVDPAAGYRAITAFLVDRGTPGFSVGKKEDKLGIRASSTCELLFEDCRVAKDAVLGDVGKGYKVAIETLNEGRIGIGAQMVGLAQGALDHAVRYVKERKQFGRAIADFQGVQFQLARAATDVEAARLLVYNAARLRDAGRPFLAEAAMAKIFSSEVAERVASLAVNLFGGYGFTKDYPVEKLYRDQKIGQIYEGTSNMQLQTIAKLLLG
ncbi:MAG: acyl-CoA dehydrogenase [Acidobacteria bacterium]|nr:acyl-CoA dehydrogenase [Acidobacteriota bacterium]